MQQRFFVDEPVFVESMTIDEVEEIYEEGSKHWGISCRCLGSRLRQIGWNPQPPLDLAKYVDQQLGYEIEEIYGITIEEQDLEAE